MGTRQSVLIQGMTTTLNIRVNTKKIVKKIKPIHAYIFYGRLKSFVSAWRAGGDRV